MVCAKDNYMYDRKSYRYTLGDFFFLILIESRRLSKLICRQQFSASEHVRQTHDGAHPRLSHQHMFMYCSSSFTIVFFLNPFVVFATAANGVDHFLKVLYGERVLTKKEKEKLEKLAKLRAKQEKEAIEAVL